MDKTAFTNAVENWIVDFRAECKRLFDDDCHPLEVMKSAMQIADSKANHAAAKRAAFAVPPGARVAPMKN